MKEVSCNVTVSIDSISVNSIEQAVLEGAREAGRRLFLAFLGLIERALPKDRTCDCGGRLESRGRVNRELMTVVGDILFNRQKLRCINCGKEEYPLDKALGIPARRLVTPGLREKALWLATEMAYDRASSGMSKLCNISISDETIKNLVVEEGSEVIRQKEEERKKVWEMGEEIAAGKGKDRVFVQVDGTGINDRATKGWFEAKVGVIFSETKEVSKDRVEILDKRTYATVEDISTFKEHFVIEAQKYGVFQSKEVIFVGDGASWCRGLKEDYFPEATYVLDFWHLARNIKICLGTERRDLIDGLLNLAGRGATSELLSRLERLRLHSREPTLRAKLLELISYVSNNKDGIENASRIDFYGSGPVEKAVDVTICRRFKKRGMSWYVHKANPLLALKLLKLNGEWETYWRQKGLVTV
jgi:hypothetical protein